MYGILDIYLVPSGDQKYTSMSDSLSLYGTNSCKKCTVKLVYLVPKDPMT